VAWNRVTLIARRGEGPEHHLGSDPEPEPADPIDLALVLTSASRSLDDAERELLVAAAGAASRTFVVVDEMDMLRLSEDVDRMEEAVEVAAERLLGHRVPAFGVATARIAGLPPSAASLVPALARQVEAALRAPEILGPKLRRPAEAALELARARRAAVEEELRALAPDLANLEVIERCRAGFEEAAETALRRAIDAADRAVGAYAEDARGFVRRWTRPFRFGAVGGIGEIGAIVGIAGARRLAERFEDGPAGAVRRRLASAADGLAGDVRRAAEEARRVILERLREHPTERLRASGALEEGADPARSVSEAVPGAGGAGAEGLVLAAPTGRGLLGPLRRASLLALGLVAVGVGFAAVPFVWGIGQGIGLLPLALGGGLGGAAILAAVGVLELRRRSLVEGLSARVEEHRAAAADALTARAEALAEEGRRGIGAIRGSGAAYAGALARDRDRLEGGRDELDRLAEGFDRLLARLG
jgi:hypothetical protein